MPQHSLRRLCSLLFAMLLAFACMTIPQTAAYASDAGDVFIAPTLPSDVDPYDPEKPDELQADQLYARSAIVIEATSGEVIFEKDADARMYPASTTKILTVLLGIMMGDLTQEVYMTDTALQVEEGSASIGLDAGESIVFRDLLYATMLRSGNDGANLIAETISGSNEAFAELMNTAAAMYGCTGTHFTNPHGLFDENHYTTARDMARIAQAAMQNETFRDIVRTYTYSLPRSNLHRARVLTSRLNVFLNPNVEDNDYYYPYATGIKTGYIARAGHCFVGSASRDGVDLVSVVLYTTEAGRWTDSTKLLEYGFSQFVSMTPAELYAENPIVVETTSFSTEDTDLGRLELQARAQENSRTVQIVATKAEMESMARNLRQTVLIEYARDFVAPIQQGEIMGTMTYYPSDGGSPVVYDLVAARTIERRENAPLSLEEIEAEVYADPNPFPPLSVELVLIALSPILVVVALILILRRVTRKTGRHKTGRVPKPKNRYFR